MSLISEAIAIATKAKAEQESAVEAKRLAELKWDADHALRMLDDIKSEVKDHVLKAAAKGERNTYVTVYAWENNGRPRWVNLAMPAVESYLTDEGFKFHFNDVDDSKHRDIEMPQCDSGGYELSW